MMIRLRGLQIGLSENYDGGRSYEGNEAKGFVLLSVLSQSSMVKALV